MRENRNSRGACNCVSAALRLCIMFVDSFQIHALQRAAQVEAP